MFSHENEKENVTGRDEDQATLPMDDQGPSYSSSYNESTPGEITENRRQSLNQEQSEESMVDHGFGGEDQSNP
jgi:hypothetical protein